MYSILLVPVIWMATTAWFLRNHRHSLEQPGRKATDIVLLKSPNKFNAIDVSWLLLVIVSKKLLSLIGLATSLSPSRTNQQGFELPHVKISGQLSIDEVDLARFDTAVPPQSSDDPVSDIHPLLLSTLTAPLVIYLLSLPSCPIQPLGSVNTKTRVSIPASLSKDASLVTKHRASLLKASKSGRISYVVSLGGESLAPRTKRGVQFTITTRVYFDADEIMTQEFSALQFLPKETLPHFSAANAVPDEGHTMDLDSILHASQHSYQLKLASSDPRKWASCGKDYNPIHVSTLAARLFGQPGIIAHGMHVVALALEATRSSTADQETGALIWDHGPQGGELVIEAKFLKTILLPTAVRVQASEAESAQEKDEVQLGIVKNDKVLTWIRCARLDRVQ